MEILGRILEVVTPKPSVDELFSAIEGYEDLKEILYLLNYHLSSIFIQSLNLNNLLI